MSQWRVYAKKADFEDIAKTFQITPYTARLIRNRNIVGNEAIRKYLFGTAADLYDPIEMKDLKKGAEILEEDILRENPIRIIGDYDVDGVSSLSILYKGLKRLGANVDWTIPHRIRDGYGLHSGMVEEAFADGVHTILTCDNGISAVEAVCLAKEKGMQVVITDHHEIPEVLPPADAIINPHQKECGYPYSDLCGAGVAYKLMVYLYKRRNIPQEETGALLQLAALGTIADVVPLTDENRLIVRLGMAQMRLNPLTGLEALMGVHQLLPERLDSRDIGFIIAPALNAGGRLESAKRSARLLLEENQQDAYQMADELKALNESRKEMTRTAFGEAVDMLQKEYTVLPPVLVVFLPACHESLAGIVAGRIREKYYRPTFVITQGEKQLKGSGRSIPGYAMFEELQKVGHFLTTFGGHPMAAGLSLLEENLAPFREALLQNCRLSENELTKKLFIDMEFPFNRANLPWMSELQLLEPFGKDNESPRFAEKHVLLSGLRQLGRQGDTLQLMLLDEEGCRHQALLFSGGLTFIQEMEVQKGKQSVQDTMGGYGKCFVRYTYHIRTETFRDMLQVKQIIEEMELE